LYLQEKCNVRVISGSLQYNQVLNREGNMLKVSNSSTSMFRTCPKKYYWHYIEGLTPKSKSLALTLGSALHQAFDAHYSQSGSPITQIREVYKEANAKAANHFNQVEDLAVDENTAAAMWAYYPHKDLSQYEEIQSEKEFEIQFGKLRSVRFVGRVDGLVKVKGLYWIRELKTTSFSPKQFKGRQSTSIQATAYVYALQRMGIDVKGVIYDCVRKPRLYKRVDEDMVSYAKRITNLYKYDGALPQNSRKYYLQHPEYRSRVQLRHYEEDMTDTINDIRRHRNKGQWNRNMDSCWRFNSMCPYSKVCFMDQPDKLTVELNYDRKGVK